MVTVKSNQRIEHFDPYQQNELIFLPIKKKKKKKKNELLNVNFSFKSISIIFF